MNLKELIILSSATTVKLLTPETAHQLTPSFAMASESLKWPHNERASHAMKLAGQNIFISSPRAMGNSFLNLDRVGNG